MKMSREVKRFAGKVKGKLTTVFEPEHLEVLAHQTDFIQRASSKLTGRDFAELMTTEMVADPAVSLAGLCDRLRHLNPQAEISPQALHQRINTPHAVAYLHALFALALRENLEPVCATLPAALLAPFGRVLLEDSTHCRLHEKLAETFKGSGGSASTSTVKIDVIYDLKHHQLHDLHITDGRAADQGRAAAIVPHLMANDLVVRDLGYFSLDVLSHINTRQAWFLSRLCKSVDVYRSADAQASALALVAHLQHDYPDHAVVDLPLYVGQQRLPCRVVAYRLPEDIVEHRRRQAAENARKKGRTLTPAYSAWLQFGWYITNVSATVWAAHVVATVYRIRWQQELLFKHWKSLLHLHVLKGTRPERIKCLLYGRLITITLMTILSSYASWYAAAYLQREVSLHKLINWLKRDGRFAKALHGETWDVLLIELRRDLPKLLCKQKRKRRTTQQLLEEYGHNLDCLSEYEATLTEQAA